MWWAWLSSGINTHIIPVHLDVLIAFYFSSVFACLLLPVCLWLVIPILFHHYLFVFSIVLPSPLPFPLLFLTLLAPLLPLFHRLSYYSICYSSFLLSITFFRPPSPLLRHPHQYPFPLSPCISLAITRSLAAINLFRVYFAHEWSPRSAPDQFPEITAGSSLSTSTCISYAAYSQSHLPISTCSAPFVH